MPASATPRPPDVVEIPPPPPSTASRGNRLQKFVTQRLAASREQVSMIAWDTKTKTWGAWYDTPPDAQRTG